MTQLRGSLRLIVAAAFVAAAALGLPSTPAQARTVPKHVAVVVAGVATACVPWHSGMTGSQVLSDAGFDVTYGQQGAYAGFVLKINGTPANPDPSKNYWAYFHNTGGGWVYSGTGPSSYHPPAGSVDGWAYDKETGGSTDVQPPPAYSYASICGSQDPTVAPTHPAAPKPTHSATRHTTHPATQPAPPGSSPPGTTGTTASGHTTRPAAKRAGTSSPVPTPAGTSSTDGMVLANALPTAPPKAEHSAKQSGIPPWGTALAIVLVAALGGGAFWRTRARRQQSP